MNDSRFDRRQFLGGMLAAGAAAATGFSPLGAFGADTGKPAAGPIGDYKISLAEWSLHKALFANEMTNMDFPRVARERFGFEAVEFVNQFFKDEARNEKYLKDLKQRAADFGVTCVLIMIDLRGIDMSAKEAADRTKAIEAHKPWVDAAAMLGCHAIRINTGGNYSPTDVSTISESCGMLNEYALSKNIKVICENHGGPSSNPDALIPLMKQVNSPNFGTLPDFGNFPKDKEGKYTIDIYDAIARMMPYAHGVSAKSYHFDAKGDETKLDYPRILKIVTDAGYKGHVGVEYEGTMMPEPEGIKATKKLLETIRGHKYTG